jgi:polyprenyl-phospho-N-acetylgalactosaminyl synthase
MTIETMRFPGLWAVIPAYNEASQVERVVASLLPLGIQVVVVNDASRDETAHAARAAWVVSHPINLGQGAALQTGISFALGRGARFIVTFDADGQHRPQDIDVLWDTLHRCDADVVLGSRFLGGTANMPRSRRLLLKLAVLFQWLTSGVRLTDAHNGLRLINEKAARAIQLQENRMAHASEIIDQFQTANLRIVEAPVTIVYTEYSLAKGQTSGNAVAIALSVLSRKFFK